MSCNVKIGKLRAIRVVDRRRELERRHYVSAVCKHGGVADSSDGVDE